MALPGKGAPGTPGLKWEKEKQTIKPGYTNRNKYKQTNEEKTARGADETAQASALATQA